MKHCSILGSKKKSDEDYYFISSSFDLPDYISTYKKGRKLR